VGDVEIWDRFTQKRPNEMNDCALHWSKRGLAGIIC